MDQVNNYEKAREFIETAPDETLRNIILDLMFYEPTGFIENYITDEYDL